VILSFKSQVSNYKIDSSSGTHRSLYISSLKVKVIIQKIWGIQDISSIFMLIGLLNYLTTREE